MDFHMITRHNYAIPAKGCVGSWSPPLFLASPFSEQPKKLQRSASERTISSQQPTESLSLSSEKVSSEPHVSSSPPAVENLHGSHPDCRTADTTRAQNGGIDDRRSQDKSQEGASLIFIHESPAASDKVSPHKFKFDILGSNGDNRPQQSPSAGTPTSCMAEISLLRSKAALIAEHLDAGENACRALNSPMHSRHAAFISFVLNGLRVDRRASHALARN